MTVLDETRANLSGAPCVSSSTVALKALLPGKRYRNRCIYCGYRCYGRTCIEHRDLVQIEAGVA